MDPVLYHKYGIMVIFRTGKLIFTKAPISEKIMIFNLDEKNHYFSANAGFLVNITVIL